MKKTTRIAYALFLLIATLFLLTGCFGNRAANLSQPADGKELTVLKDDGEILYDENGNAVTRKVVILDDNMLLTGDTDLIQSARFVKLGKAVDADGNVLKESDGSEKTFVSEVLDEEKNLLRDADTIVEVITVGSVEKYAKYDKSGKRDANFLYVEKKDSNVAAEDNETYKKKWNEYILTPVGWLMTQINNLVHSYIFTLFVFAILVKILFLYFSIRQHKSSIKQAYFKPKEQAIRNKYKGRTDQATMQKMQQEISDAQQKEGVSPFSGCLPLLIQLPIIFLLYEVIRNPLSYVANYGKQTIAAVKNVLCYNDLAGAGWDFSMLGRTAKSALSAGSVGSLQELDLVPLLRQNFEAFKNIFGMGDKTAAGLPNFFAFGKYVDLSYTPQVTFNWPLVLYLLVPALTFVTLFISMKLNRKMTNAGTQAPAAEGQPDMRMANTVMDLGMPLMSTVFTFMVPALLGVYWIFNNLLGTLQQFILVKVMPYPVFTEEDYKKAEKEYNKGKEVKKHVEKDPNRPKVRSLHHIDDDDDDDYPTLPPAKADREQQDSVVPKAPLKSDDFHSAGDQKNNDNQ